MKDLSVIIPVFSEVSSLNITILSLIDDLKELNFEIILAVHPKSTNDCIENCNNWSQKNSEIRTIIQKKTPGQGFAYREAIEITNAKFICLMNADLETAPSDVIRLFRKINESENDVVIASRWNSASEFKSSEYGLIKKLLNYLFQKIFMFLFQTKITDLTFCYKIAKSEVFKNLNWAGEQHEFALETTLVPIALNMKVSEISTTWKKRNEGKSNFAFSRNMRHLKLALTIFYLKLQNNLNIYENSDIDSK